MGAPCAQRIVTEAGLLQPEDRRALLLMSNTSISYISEQLGHKDPTVTVEHYARWLPGSNQAAMNVLPGAAGDLRLVAAGVIDEN